MSKKASAPRSRAGAPGNRKRTPVVVAKPGPNWGMIALFGLVGAVVLGLIAWSIITVTQKNNANPSSPSDIEGLSNFRTGAELGRNHVQGDQTYPQSPPVGGNHNPAWETCNGVVYTQQVPDEHAVHSLEHGAVWITYSPDLPADQIASLSKRVEGKDYTLMSPYPGLDKPISLQAWGYQLKVDKADDERITQFINLFRLKASVEPGATCNGGVQATGAAPVDTSQGA
ncbi:hypothetical protein Afil01_65250 [Actinorhabdospora filicis]|uniref:DUF3105 domain-containing protein n=1 Tax=Actinorhabdospora filicis TaxID=1785913 RepID=A0A9W6STE1_9ACTN|nr:DUF3105 domain-containing protein [Actinorhabdospora filicis]GLZ81718.1 hypothetical protein Afil01_65250 [Actinorhabdospora filicis]